MMTVQQAQQALSVTEGLMSQALAGMQSLNPGFLLPWMQTANNPAAQQALLHPWLAALQQQQLAGILQQQQLSQLQQAAQNPGAAATPTADGSASSSSAGASAAAAAAAATAAATATATAALAAAASADGSNPVSIESLSAIAGATAAAGGGQNLEDELLSQLRSLKQLAK
jgi:hypothetical protein